MGRDRFIGRVSQLALLSAELESAAADGQGRFVLVRGRRQVGKSRLLQELIARSQPPHMFFSATKGRTASLELEQFTEQLAASTLAVSRLVRAGATFRTWEAALAAIAESSERARPSLIVLDELPYLAEQDASFEGSLQTAWDRHLRDTPVVLVVIGSDVAMMDALTDYGRPLYGRPTRVLRLDPLSPADVAGLTGLEPAAALDAYLVVGGFPLLVRTWGRELQLGAFLARELADPTSPLLVVGERMMAAEFPPDAQARSVLSAIGHGGRTFTKIGARAGVPRQSLERALQLLVAKRVIARELPLSTRPSREARYHVADPYLRFWLRFVEPAIPEVERGRGADAAIRIRDAWAAYRGSAIEPVIREAVGRMLPDPRFAAARHVGSFWRRNSDMQVDIVGTATEPASRRIELVGSVKWRERSPFGERDANELARLLVRVPGTDDRTLQVGVSRSGFRTGRLDVALQARDILDAFASS